MLIIRLRLQAFHLQTGHYPAALNELKGLTSSDLEDPFAPAPSPLHYRSNRNAFTLWSVGPDAADNNGRPIRKLRPGFSNAGEDSVGDLVTPLPPSSNMGTGPG